jgi:hypothetical protein
VEPDDIDRWKPQPAGVEEHRDELPIELDASGYVGPYLFPDNKRRRIAGAVYLVVGACVIGVWIARHHGGVLVDDGLLAGGLIALGIGLYHQVAGWPLEVKDLDALTVASATVGFPIGHASAQLGWRGLLSRPTWRILLYSADDPPSKRGLVLVDGVNGQLVDHFVEDNPEDWSDL